MEAKKHYEGQYHEGRPELRRPSPGTKFFCDGEHRFFVPEDGIVFLQDERRLCIVIVCTSCGESRLVDHSLKAH